MQTFSHPFEPYIHDDSRFLLLGTFPSIKSFEDNFYYAHPKNQFWKLLSEVFKEQEPNSLQQKKDFLQKHKIALWDMIKSCQRENSLDSNLKNIEVHDIEKLLQKYPNIEKIFFTSKTAQKLYLKNFSHLNIKYQYLDSPSPAYAKKSFLQKLENWRKAFEV